MTGKYADRFRPSSPSGLRDVLDLGETEHRSLVHDDHDADELVVEPPPGRRWHQSRAARSAVVAALVVGAGGGAYAWDRWESYEAGVAAQSAVDLFASATPLDYPTQSEITIAMRYRNDGEHDLVVRDVRLDSSRAVIVGDPRVLTIAPGDSETHTLDLRAQCEDGATGSSAERPPLAVEVETVDGTISTTILDSNFTYEIVSWLGYACETMSYIPTFGDSYGEVVQTTPSVDGRSLEARIVIGYGEEVDITISEVHAMSNAFTVESRLDVQTGEQASFTVVFRVGQCILAEQASDLDMSLRIEGSYDGGLPGHIEIPPSATLAAELVRLTQRSCPA